MLEHQLNLYPVSIDKNVSYLNQNMLNKTNHYISCIETISYKRKYCNKWNNNFLNQNYDNVIIFLEAFKHNRITAALVEV